MGDGAETRDASQALFDALADPTRRRLLERLAEQAESISISELTESLPITRQAVTKHLALLERAELVQAERRGRERRYTFAPQPLDRAATWIAALEARWDARLTALQRMLQEESDVAGVDRR